MPRCAASRPTPSPAADPDDQHDDRRDDLHDDQPTTRRGGTARRTLCAVDFALEEVGRVVALEGDPAALGGAVTTALCGHWEHDPPCRWPHHVEVQPDDDGWWVSVAFDAAPDQVDDVRERIRDALASGALVGPDGRRTTWRAAGQPG
jgi:hypothetical protein